MTLRCRGVKYRVNFYVLMRQANSFVASKYLTNIVSGTININGFEDIMHSIQTNKIAGVARFLIIVLAISAVCENSRAKQLATECGTLENAFGPFDYTDSRNSTLRPGQEITPLQLVENEHFTRDVRNLVRGNTSLTPVGDLEYTLRAFPNHHGALHSLANYHLINGVKKHGQYTIECWFDRAMLFRPDDAIVRVVFGVFLAKRGSTQDALDQYNEALRLRDNLPEAHYNIGLLYTDLEQYDLAYQHAVRAYNLGYPLPGLRNRLMRLGAWKDPNSE